MTFNSPLAATTEQRAGLDADMIARGPAGFRPAFGSVVMIANIAFTEAVDKPPKYPHIFRAAQMVVLDKTGLLPHLGFDTGLAAAIARKVNPHIRVLQFPVRGGKPAAARRMASFTKSKASAS